MKLKGKVALVTGSSRGMGRPIAVELAREGADIVLTARTMKPGMGEYPGSLEEAAAEVEAQGAKALPIQCDLSDGEQVRAMCRKALGHFGHVDILVNNAFFSNDQQFSMFLDLRRETWEKYVAVNLMAPVITCQEILPSMIKNRQGMLVFVSSRAGYPPEPPGVPGGGKGAAVCYSASKGGMHRFAQGLSKETALHNIPVVLVDPEYTLTERAQARSAKVGGFNLSFYHPMEVPAKTIGYLCTCPNPMFYNGKTILVGDFVQEHNLTKPGYVKSESTNP